MRLDRLNKLKHFIYLSDSNLNNQTASSLQVLKMASEICKAGVDTTIYSHGNPVIDSLKVDYKLDSGLKYSSYSKYVGTSKISYYFISSVNLIKLIISYSKSKTFFYGRNLLLLSFLNLFRRKVGLELHGIYENPGVKSKIKKILLKRIPMIVVISQALKDDLILMYEILQDKIIVLHDGADKVDLIDSEPHSKNEKLVVGYVGSFYKGRGVDMIFDIAKEITDYRFILVGAKNSDIINFKAKLLEVNNVDFVEHLPHSKLSYYYSKFDVVIAPYEKKISVFGSNEETSRWFSPLKLFEYMSYCKPILISDLKVLNEILIDNEDCLFCGVENTKDWIDKLNLVRDPHLRTRIANNAHKKFNEKYTWEKRVDHLMNSIQGYYHSEFELS